MENPTLQVGVEAVRRLRAEVRGRVIGPEDADYDAARALFFAGFDRRPAAVARVADATDVARVVTVARDAGLPLAVRSGGHSACGHGAVDGGIVIDLSAMRGLEIDAAGRTAWAETGLEAGAYTAAVGAHGLATGFGDAGSVGIGGITLGGGIGFLHRKYGMTIDSLLVAEVVTADGELVRADAASHPDLFWAVRGGGGNFGVATRFRYLLHEVGDVLGGMMIFPATPGFLVSLLELLTEAPDALSGVVTVMVAPPMPFIPTAHHGKLVAMTTLVHAGPVDEGERVVDRLRALAPPIVDMMRPLPYAKIYEGGEPPMPARIAVRSTFVDTFDRGVAEAIFGGIERSSAPMRMAQLRVLGGAVARIPDDATAFAYRSRGLMAIVGAMFEAPEAAAEHEAWADRFIGELRQGAPGAYIGFLSGDDEAAARAAYPGRTWERLAEVKARYDPTNLFRLNLNVQPAGAAPARDGAA